MPDIIVEAPYSPTRLLFPKSKFKYFNLINYYRDIPISAILCESFILLLSPIIRLKNCNYSN